MNRRFLLVRHGESIWNKDSKFTGWTNIPLTDAGRQEAKTIAKTLLHANLIPNIIFSSVLSRTIDTANLIKSELNLPNMPLHTSWRLNEKHYGTLEGVPRKHIRDTFGERFTRMMRSDFYMKPPILSHSGKHAYSKYPIYRNCYFESIKNGESKENVLQRLLPYYENDIMYTIQTEFQLPIIVTHKHTARVLMKHLLKIGDVEFEHYELPNRTILQIHIDEKMNYKSHDEISF